MATFTPKDFITGAGMALNNAYLWSAQYTPLFVELTIATDKELTTPAIVWQTDSTTAFLDVASQTVTLVITSASAGTNSGFPLYSTLAPGTALFYALDFRQLVGDDNEFRIQGRFFIRDKGGLVGQGNVPSEILSLGDATVTITDL